MPEPETATVIVLESELEPDSVTGAIAMPMPSVVVSELKFSELLSSIVKAGVTAPSLNSATLLPCD